MSIQNPKNLEKLSILCFLNSDQKYKDAIHLSENESYGSAISSLIISYEESVKGLFLLIDSCGFEFITRVKGLRNILENHNLRYHAGYAISIINLIVSDFKKLRLFESDFNERIIALAIKLQDNPEMVFNYATSFMDKMVDEILWFSKFDRSRQAGMYVDFSNQIDSPNNLREQDFIEFKHRIDDFINIVSQVRKSIEEWREEENSALVGKLINKELIKNSLYQNLSLAVKYLNNRKINAFEKISNEIEELSTDITSDQEMRKIISTTLKREMTDLKEKLSTVSID